MRGEQASLPRLNLLFLLSELRIMNKLAVILFSSVLVFSQTPFAAAEVPASFAFTGSGYGHGVGMSQIGAKAKAVAGESATAILTYYYKDVVVAPVVDTHTIRVNIGTALKTFSVSTTQLNSKIDVFVGDVPAAVTPVPALTISPQTAAIFAVEGNTVAIGAVKGRVLTVRWGAPNTILTFFGPGKPVRYKYGQIQVKVVRGALEVTNSLSIHDEYLWGISEVSSAWPAAVLEAQAIAARSYALAKIGSIRSVCDCHVYSHIGDQNFVGFSKEAEPKIGKLWKAAVQRTNVDTSTSLAVLHQGKPIQAFYSSSSGGATQTTFDAWGQATPYTQSVADPAGLDPKLNPRFAQWKASATQEILAKAFLLADIVTLEIISRNSAGAVTYIKGTSSNGSTKLLRGDTFRSRAKIPSPYFNLG